MKDCEYRLPCNWCNKFDKVCDITTHGIHISKCEHDWQFRGQTETTGGREITYYCNKCGITKIKKIFPDGSIYETGFSNDVKSWL